MLTFTIDRNNHITALTSTQQTQSRSSAVLLSQLKLNEVLSVVQLYKALGGGWQ